MEYKTSKLENSIIVEVSGRIDKGGVISAGAYARSLHEYNSVNIILDVDGLEDEREMFYHVALINTFKKEAEQGGGTFRLRSSRRSLKSYLSMTGLDRLFIFDAPANHETQGGVVNGYPGS